jgi:hypothetical protein
MNLRSRGNGDLQRVVFCVRVFGSRGLGTSGVDGGLGQRTIWGALHPPLQFSRVGTAAQKYPRIGVRQRLEDIHKSTYYTQIAIKNVCVEWGAAVSKSRPIHNRAVAHQAVHVLVPQKGILGFVLGDKVFW